MAKPTEDDFDDGFHSKEIGGIRPNKFAETKTFSEAEPTGFSPRMTNKEPEKKEETRPVETVTAKMERPFIQKPVNAPQGFHHPYKAEQTPVNPLSKYLRAPGLSIRLPTDGIFMPEGSIDFTMSGEVQVYPMRAADELLLKSPDALMNGYAVESLLNSCVPALKYPRMISTPDLDVLLLAIRAASYGSDMDIEVTCPKCKGESKITVDLRQILSRSNLELPDNAVRINKEITIYVRPYDLNNATQVSMAAFTESRAVQAAENDPKRSQMQINESYKRMTDLDIAMTADCVLQIIVPEGSVTDKKMIKDFINNIERSWVKKINDTLKALNGAGLDKATPVECFHCHHQWESKVEFDPSSFFDLNS